MNKVEQQVECVNCTWDKLCIKLPSMTEEEVEAKMKPPELAEADMDKAEAKVVSGVMMAIFYGGKDRECPACPVFIEKLRERPDLSNKIKEIMKSY